LFTGVSGIGIKGVKKQPFLEHDWLLAKLNWKVKRDYKVVKQLEQLGLEVIIVGA